MVNDVLRRVRYRCGRLATWSEREQILHYLVYPRTPSDVPTLINIVRTCPGVERVWRAQRCDLNEEAIISLAISALSALSPWRDLDVALRNNARELFPSKIELKARIVKAIQTHFGPQGRIVHSNKRGTDAFLEIRLTPNNACTLS